MQIYHFVLSHVYRETFGSELPHKPKPFRINLLLNAIFLGWLQLRTKVLQKFQLCKDIEFACILHLLDEVIPLSFFHYPVIFPVREPKFLCSCHVKICFAVHYLETPSL